jgi:agmatinase
MVVPHVKPLVFANLPPERTAYETARTAVLGAPYDGTIPTRGGAKDGPAAILLASQEIETYELELDDDASRLGIATLGMIDVDVDGPAAMAANVERAIGAVADAGKLPLLLGGEHSVTVGAVRALADRYPDLTVLQIDAHADLRDSYQGSRMSHACAMRRVIERCPAVQIGIRSLGEEERNLIRSGGLTVVRHDELRRDAAAIDRALARLSGHVYLTIDLDALDPSIMPAVAFPEPGGLGWHETLAIARAAAARATIVGCDVVELAPALGSPACAYLAAHLAYRLIGYATLT